MSCEYRELRLYFYIHFSLLLRSKFQLLFNFHYSSYIRYFCLVDWGRDKGNLIYIEPHAGTAGTSKYRIRSRYLGKWYTLRPYDSPPIKYKCMEESWQGDWIDSLHIYSYNREIIIITPFQLPVLVSVERIWDGLLRVQHQ